MQTLDQYRVLLLNKNWIAFGVVSVRRAYKDMSKDSKTGNEKDRPFLALHIEFPELENGEIDFNNYVSLVPVKWDDWIALPIRSHDKFVRTSHSAIRVPTILITSNYGKIPLKTPQYSSNEIAKRDQYIDQYTGKFVPRHKGNIDHHIPRNLGGTTGWDNCVWTAREINELKADMHPNEFYKKYGHKLLKKPTKPKPRINIVNRYNIPEWNIFLKG